MSAGVGLGDGGLRAAAKYTRIYVWPIHEV